MDTVRLALERAFSAHACVRLPPPSGRPFPSSLFPTPSTLCPGPLRATAAPVMAASVSALRCERCGGGETVSFLSSAHGMVER